ncbi:DUF1269 domain-containing protein [Paractinoplanes rishiriensis]|uniref:Membrane protein n=1 Tax=Paractinoplanes rishiriensis TaxID=1050105 RepID=A0A919KBB3_9ACTN|nr:DUF1269 domain-containing protein [Actinoplanes rishiriensis]GIF00152.1 membrane protein [Actinoplanes rishiriensis]
MTTFTVWKFDSADGAERATDQLRRAESEGLVKILDHAAVIWPEGASQPTRLHGHDGVWRGAGWGALWGLLCGTLFLVPLVGGAVGAGLGALSKATEDSGIRKEELERIRTEVTEGTSALFLVTDAGNLDRLGERFHGFGLHSKLISTNLTDGEREILLETFGGGQKNPQPY